jgi:hypothetical protein
MGSFHEISTTETLGEIMSKPNPILILPLLFFITVAFLVGYQMIVHKRKHSGPIFLALLVAVAAWFYGFYEMVMNVNEAQNTGEGGSAMWSGAFGTIYTVAYSIFAFLFVGMAFFLIKLLRRKAN